MRLRSLQAILLLGRKRAVRHLKCAIDDVDVHGARQLAVRIWRSMPKFVQRLHAVGDERGGMLVDQPYEMVGGIVRERTIRVLIDVPAFERDKPLHGCFPSSMARSSNVFVSARVSARSVLMIP